MRTTSQEKRGCGAFASFGPCIRKRANLATRDLTGSSRRVPACAAALEAATDSADSRPSALGLARAHLVRLARGERLVKPGTVVAWHARLSTLLAVEVSASSRSPECLGGTPNVDSDDVERQSAVGRAADSR